MKIKNLILAMGLLVSSAVFAKGGDDVGNGGFAYRQSVIILKKATEDLEDKIRNSTMRELVDNPNWRTILQDTLGYQNLDKLSKKNQYRGGRKLAMNYIVNPPTVIVLKPYFEAFAGKTDTELEDASLEVQKRLLHEAAHIWGYKEEAAEEFAVAFLKNVDNPDPGPVDPRPNDISIKSNFCSCLNGKSDILNDCDAFCATAPMSNRAVLFVETILGQETANHPKLGSLYNWCNVQLSGETAMPQCMLNASDGVNSFNIPVTVETRSNRFTADISSLKKNTTYLLKLVEWKTGNNSQTEEFQLRRKNQTLPGEEMGMLKVTPISQYTCLTFGGRVNSNGEVIRTDYVKSYFYHPANETPSPLPPVAGGVPLMVCHDEQAYPGNDSIEYPRLENVSEHLLGWDKTDVRFSGDLSGKKIDKMIERNLLDDYGISTRIDLFRYLSYKTPNNKTSMLGYIMAPFVSESGKAFCPTETHYNSTYPLFNVLGKFMGATEGIYLAEKEGEVISGGAQSKTVYGTMLVKESVLTNYGFYISNGLKTRANSSDLHERTIHYYWPTSTTADPLIQGNRKLFTVKTVDALNENPPVGIPTGVYTSDKRLGCIPQ